MELLFQEYDLTYLERVCDHKLTGEQTVDVIIPDNCPDVDRIIDAFGTLMVQKGQLVGGSVEISAKVQAGVLFAGEDGDIHKVSVEIPLTLGKDGCYEGEDGILFYHCELKSVDARAVNSRKLLVRAGIRWSIAIYGTKTEVLQQLEEPSEQLQLREAEYPLGLPVVTGEKSFIVNEELELPSNQPAVTKLLKWQSRLQVLEEKAVGNKAVFKMEILLHLLYEDPQGKLCTYEWRLPLSQFVDLSGDAEEGTLQISLQVTELDLEADSLEESHRLFLRMGIMAQCMVREIRSIRLIEDAFCTDALLEPRWKEWNCRPLLDSRTLQGTAQWRGEEALGTPLELWATAEEPQAERQEDCIKLKVPLCCTLLYYDGDGTLRGKELHPTMEAELPVNPSADCVIREIHCGEIYCNVASGRLELRIPVELTVDTYGNQKLRGLQGGKINPLPDTGERRPSVILRRMEQEEDLWTVAKEYRSPIKALREVNDLPDDRVPQGMMLLIPV